MKTIRKAIAIDFDGCLCTDAYPHIGMPNWAAISRAAKEREGGAGLILWTCREGKLLREALDAALLWGLPFDAVNESLPEWIDAFGTRPRKVGATEYWDDRAVWIQAQQAAGAVPLGGKLKALRHSRGETQQGLALALGVSKSSVNMYERGEREPNLKTLIRIADHFDTSIDFLLGRLDGGKADT